MMSIITFAWPEEPTMTMLCCVVLCCVVLCCVVLCCYFFSFILYCYLIMLCHSLFLQFLFCQVILMLLGLKPNVSASPTSRETGICKCYVSLKLGKCYSRPTLLVGVHAVVMSLVFILFLRSA